MTNQAAPAPIIVTYAIGETLSKVERVAREGEAFVLETDLEKAKSLGLPKKIYFSKPKHSTLKIRYDRGPLFVLEKKHNHSTQHRDGILEVSIFNESRLLIFVFKKSESTIEDLPF